MKTWEVKCKYLPALKMYTAKSQRTDCRGLGSTLHAAPHQMGFSENKLDSGWWKYTPELERRGPANGYERDTISGLPPCQPQLLLAVPTAGCRVAGIIQSRWLIMERLRTEI